jgi:Arm DNA-binding domain
MGRTKTVGNGEGAIVTIRRGGKIVGYAPEISLGYIDGKRKRKRGEIYKTRGEARNALAELKQQHESGVDLLSKAPKVRDYFPIWLTHFAKVGRGRSIDTYGWAIDRVIIPRLGDSTLKKVTTLQLDQLFTDLLNGTSGRKRMAAKSVILVRTVLRQAFKQAMLWGIATRNRWLIPSHPRSRAATPRHSPSRRQPRSWRRRAARGWSWRFGWHSRLACAVVRCAGCAGRISTSSTAR